MQQRTMRRALSAQRQVGRMGTCATATPTPTATATPTQQRMFHLGRGIPRTASRLFDQPTVQTTRSNSTHSQQPDTPASTATTTNSNNTSSTTSTTPSSSSSTAQASYHETRKILHQDKDVTKIMTTVALDRGQPVDLYHELHGHGKHKVLFITGWAGSCDNWRFQTDFFGRHGDFEVCIYENRGSGFSSSPERDYAMRDMAQDAVDLMNQLGWSKAHVVGVSMGGMIAQELALLAPNRVQSLTLASTCASRALPPMKHIPWLISSFTKILLGLASPKNLMPFFLYSRRWLNLPAPENSGYTSNLEYMLKFHGGRIDSRPPQSFSSALRQLSGMLAFHVSKAKLFQLKNYFSTFAVPAMVIHGTEDALVHLRASWNLATQLGARLVVFEGRGHALNHEDIDLFNRLLLRHFYTAILPQNGRTSFEEAARRAGWWRDGAMEAMEQRAVAMANRMKRQMVGFTEWVWTFLFGTNSSSSSSSSVSAASGKDKFLGGMEIEWLPPVPMTPVAAASATAPGGEVVDTVANDSLSVGQAAKKE